MTKTCSKCKLEKDYDSFRWRSKAKGTKQSWCKECCMSHEETVWDDSQERRDTNNAQRKLRRQRNYEYVFRFLQSQKCMDCPESNPIVLEFDHRNQKDKKENVSKLCSFAVSLETIQAEMDKCDVVCANCHRIRTAKQFGYYSYIDLVV